MNTLKIMLVLLLLFTSTLNAQEPRPDYDQYLTWLNVGDQRLYAHPPSPVNVCIVTPINDEWLGNVIVAVNEFNTVIPTSLNGDSTCHVLLNIVETLPEGVCYRGDGSRAPACTERFSLYYYPVNVYIKTEFYQLATILHELMHAFGVRHVTDYDSAVSDEFFFLQSRLTQFDRDILTYLFSYQPFIYEQDYPNTVMGQLDAEFCAWVETHSPYSPGRTVLTVTQYEQYRCD